MIQDKAYSLKEGIVPRLYQQKIFASSIDKNTLVVLPTGLGKTLIAVMLSIYKLNKGKDGKVVFLAPTKPLVNQHHQTFIETTNIFPESLIVLTGDVKKDNRIFLWRTAKVCFMTPQTLQNDVESDAYDLRDVSLLIIDEAHKAVGDYAYTIIAKNYTTKNPSNHIFALTASPGTSHDEIQTIMDNLSVINIEIRDENDPDVKPYCQTTSIEWIHLDLPDEFLQIKELLKKEYKKVTQYIKQHDLLQDKNYDSLRRKDLIEIINNCQSEINSHRIISTETHDVFTTLKIVSIGMRLSYCLELIETQGLVALQKYLSKALKEAKLSKASKSLKIFVDIVHRKGILDYINRLIEAKFFHPKLDKLNEVVSNFLDDHDQSRVLIFANYRVTIDLIVEQLKKIGIIEVSRFVGQRSSGKKSGMSQKIQQETIQKFNDGDLKILVSTSVAEEGLDIDEVDLVVFYDVVPSAIRTIQRRGRTGRKRSGKVIVLMARNTRDEGYYYANKHKERKMKRLLEKIKQKADKKLDSFI